ncbi:MAG: signal recognition particle-docking protein FtsY [Rhodospirillales bacterium]|jgi:fused signal recognition particle receptor|nr:signal recognition particle-docking protein FtsY [Rhodospirillales bacterium]
MIGGNGGWLDRLKRGLGRSSSKIAGGITDLFTKRKLDAAAIEELEELLITADLGVATSARLAAEFAKTRFGKEVDADEVKGALADDIAAILEPVAKPLILDPGKSPHVILVCGVNGSGKTTTIAKLAGQYRKQGLSVVLAAADTFRAAAVEQLQIWGERAGCPVVSANLGADAAGLAFDALNRARDEGADVLIIDTAGRLQNRKDLMGELQKIVRVIRKLDDSAPHDCVLVMDAGVGQNAHSQVEVFREMVEITGLVLTKLDGSARGGVVVALAEQYGLPIHAIGVGETMDDMRPFEANAFSRALMGLED